MNERQKWGKRKLLVSVRLWVSDTAKLAAVFDQLETLVTLM